MKPSASWVLTMEDLNVTVYTVVFLDIIDYPFKRLDYLSK
jgi:hypothetical protein